MSAVRIGSCTTSAASTREISRMTEEYHLHFSPRRTHAFEGRSYRRVRGDGVFIAVRADATAGAAARRSVAAAVADAVRRRHQDNGGAARAGKVQGNHQGADASRGSAGRGRSETR